MFILTGGGVFNPFKQENDDGFISLILEAFFSILIIIKK
jgi:hypothetical protein